jgi:hypothetical protein
MSPATTLPVLTEFEWSLLDALDACAVRGYKSHRGHEWVRPMDLGGRGSNSAVLRRLVLRGFVETRKRGQSRGVTGALFDPKGGGKGGRLYRITSDGVSAIYRRRKVLSS